MRITGESGIYLLIFILFFGTGFFISSSYGVSIEEFFAAGGCSTLNVDGYVYEDGTARIQNNSSAECEFTLASYKVSDATDRLEGQTVFSSVTKRLDPGQSLDRAELNVGYPGCRTRFVLFVGAFPVQPAHDDNLISYIYRPGQPCGSML